MMVLHAIVTKRFDVASFSGLPSGTPMLRRSFTHAAAVLLATLLAVPLLCAQKSPVHHKRKHLEREQIEALEHDWQQAMLADDVPTMDNLLSDDYLGISANGEVFTKVQQLDHMRDRKFVITDLETSDRKVKLVGNIAIVTSLAQVEGTIDGQTLHGLYRYTRVYQRLPGGIWKITNFEGTRITHQQLPTPQNKMP
jgi:ketosteroid isomerase-like protein